MIDKQIFVTIDKGIIKSRNHHESFLIAIEVSTNDAIIHYLCNTSYADVAIGLHRMAANSISYIVGGFFALDGIFGVFIKLWNIHIHIIHSSPWIQQCCSLFIRDDCWVPRYEINCIDWLFLVVNLRRKGNCHCQTSPVYILSSQTLAVDALLVLTHLLYHAPAVAMQVSCGLLTRQVCQRDVPARSHPARRWLHLPIHPYVLLVSQLAQPHSNRAQQVKLSILSKFAKPKHPFASPWNTVSHVSSSICLRRLVVIVFKRSDIFTRSHTIALSILHHFVAAALSIATEFTLPCCTWVWLYFGYGSKTSEGRGALICLAIQLWMHAVEFSQYLPFIYFSFRLNFSSQAFSYAYDELVWVLQTKKKTRRDYHISRRVFAITLRSWRFRSKRRLH